MPMSNAIDKANKKKSRQDCIDIDYAPFEDTVILSVHKYRTYELLLSIKPDIRAAAIIGDIKEFNGKKKLPWQYKYSKEEFTPFFHLLSQHGLIEPSCYDKLKLYFPDDNGYDAEDELDPSDRVRSSTTNPKPLVFSTTNFTSLQNVKQVAQTGDPKESKNRVSALTLKL